MSDRQRSRAWRPRWWPRTDDRLRQAARLQNGPKFACPAAASAAQGTPPRPRPAPRVGHLDAPPPAGRARRAARSRAPDPLRDPATAPPRVISRRPIGSFVGPARATEKLPASRSPPQFLRKTCGTALVLVRERPALMGQRLPFQPAAVVSCSAAATPECGIIGPVARPACSCLSSPFLTLATFAGLHNPSFSGQQNQLNVALLSCVCETLVLCGQRSVFSHDPSHSFASERWAACSVPVHAPSKVFLQPWRQV